MMIVDRSLDILFSLTAALQLKHIPKSCCVMSRSIMLHFQKIYKYTYI